AGRQGGAGHDLATLPAFHCNVRPKAGARFTDHGEDCRHVSEIFKMHGETIAKRFVEARRVGVAENILSKDAMYRIEKRYGFRRHTVGTLLRLRRGHNDFQPAFNRKHSRIVLPIGKYGIAARDGKPSYRSASGSPLRA